MVRVGIEHKIKHTYILGVYLKITKMIPIKMDIGQFVGRLSGRISAGEILFARLKFLWLKRSHERVRQRFQHFHMFSLFSHNLLYYLANIRTREYKYQRCQCQFGKSKILSTVNDLVFLFSRCASANIVIC